MKHVKLKKDVDFSVLDNYGFTFNEKENTYVRPSSWFLKTVGGQLTVDVESRDVFMHIFYDADGNENEDFDGRSGALHSINLLRMYDLLEIVEEEEEK
jgi:hypothetical protein